jgi:undecaprenyl-diphosphatase
MPARRRTPRRTIGLESMSLVFQAIVIGIIQGVTEFIPISSSAHLELAPWIFGWDDSPLIGSLAFDVFLHLGTLIALLVYFWRDWVRLVGAVLASIRDRHIGVDADRRLGWLLVLGTIPAAIIGFVGEDFIDRVFHGGSDQIRLAIAGALVIGAIILVAADWFGAKRREIEQVGPWTSLAIGFSQALALLPGISRSGATISTGLALGLTRESAARFSFLLATPITLGAGLYGSRHLLDQAHTTTEWVAIAAGFAAAAISGLLAIGFLLAWLRRRSFLVFGVYRVALAALVVALVMAGR